jgi:hypothetical protein
VHSKIEQLRDHEESLRNKVTANARRTADALLAFVKHDCVELCNKVYEAFPREVRDIIYGHIISYEGVDVCSDHRSTWQSVDYFSSTSETQHRLGSSEVGTDHWWKNDFVGAKMVREIGEHYYRASHFRFNMSFSELARFRATDQFNFGFLPVYFISNLEVVVDCDDYVFWLTSSVKDNASVDEHQDQPRPERDFWGGLKTEEDLLVQLEYLFGFRPGTGITIRLVRSVRKNGTTHRKNLEWMCQHVVPVIFPVLQRLKEANYRARVLLSRTYSDKVYKTERTPFASMWNPTSPKAITASLWKVCIRSFL